MAATRLGGHDASIVPKGMLNVPLSLDVNKYPFQRWSEIGRELNHDYSLSSTKYRSLKCS